MCTEGLNRAEFAIVSVRVSLARLAPDPKIYYTIMYYTMVFHLSLLRVGLTSHVLMRSHGHAVFRIFRESDLVAWRA